MTNLVANTDRFSTTNNQASLTYPGSMTRRYLRSLPANDSDPIIAANVITDEVADAKEAQFVEVTVTPTGFAAIFPATFLSNSSVNSFNIGATAVAGFAGVVVCDMTPLFICNPFPGSDLHDVANNQTFYRKGIKLVMGSTSWGPGNMGFLRPEAVHGYGEGDLASDIARVDFPECVNSRGIYTQTGNITEKARAAFNTRFDMYGPHFSATDATVPPAPNIRRGYVFSPKNPNKAGTDSCAKEPAPADVAALNPKTFGGLTQDTAYPNFGGRLGNGLWDYESYKSANYWGSELDTFLDAGGNAYTNANPPSRYDLYKFEIDHNLVAKKSRGVAAGTLPKDLYTEGETGAPLCHATPSTDPDRRLIYAAIVDCDAYASELNGASGTIQAMAFASFFLTEPVVGAEVRAEVVDIDGNLGRGTMVDFAKDNVQLYR
jgi:hypothetical protein